MLVPEHAHQKDGKLKRRWKSTRYEKLLATHLDNQKQDYLQNGQHILGRIGQLGAKYKKEHLKQTLSFGGLLNIEEI